MYLGSCSNQMRIITFPSLSLLERIVVEGQRHKKSVFLLFLEFVCCFASVLNMDVKLWKKSYFCSKSKKPFSPQSHWKYRLLWKTKKTPLISHRLSEDDFIYIYICYFACISVIPVSAWCFDESPWTKHLRGSRASVPLCSSSFLSPLSSYSDVFGDVS